MSAASERALHLLELRRPAEALADLRRDADNLHDPDARVVEALCLLELDNLEEAAAVAMNVVSMAPDDHRGWQVLSMARRRQERVWEALDPAARAVALAPHLVTTHTSYAAALACAGHFDSAIRHAEEARRLEPDAPDGWISLSFVQLSRHQWAQAELSARAALAIDPSNANALTNLTLAQSAGGRRSAATDTAIAAIRERPDDARLRDILRDVAWGAGLPVWLRVILVLFAVVGLTAVSLAIWLTHALIRWFELPRSVRSLLWSEKRIRYQMIAVFTVAVLAVVFMSAVFLAVVLDSA